MNSLSETLLMLLRTTGNRFSAAEDAVAALEMILGAYESQLSGGRVPFPIANREHPLSR